MDWKNKQTIFVICILVESHTISTWTRSQTTDQNRAHLWIKYIGKQTKHNMSRLIWRNFLNSMDSLLQNYK